MAKGGIPEELRYKVIHLHKKGESQRKISGKTGVSKTGVQKIIERYKENGTPNDRARTGRPPKLSPSDKWYLKVSSLMDMRKSSSSLALDLKTSTGVSVHPSTVRRQLNAMSKGGLTAKKPLLKKEKVKKKKEKKKKNKTKKVKEEKVEDKNAAEQRT